MGYTRTSVSYTHLTHRAGKDELNEEDIKNLSNIENGFHEAINDDMNIPLAMSFVWSAKMCIRDSYYSQNTDNRINYGPVLENVIY